LSSAGTPKNEKWFYKTVQNFSPSIPAYAHSTTSRIDR
jgi:hypothetical protein